ncbi:MAG TPA: heavy-metal-associated domain-containing protein [Planctomycetota bacterium]|nr:heavy-metal-associated domain-containing protein [Planctomycetota bacterium]
MKRALALVAMVALAGSAIASEEEAVQLKITVEGMSCPTGCAPKVAKGLQSIPGAKDVKLADFDKGLFTMSIDAKTGISPDAFKKSVDGYKIAKIEATFVGKITEKDKKIVLTTAAGQSYVLTVGAPPECCADDKAAKPAPKPEESPLLKSLRTKLEGFAKEGKTAKVVGVMAECCDVSVTIASIDAVEKATN